MCNNITEYNKIIHHNIEKIEDEVLAVIFSKRAKFCIDSAAQIIFNRLKIWIYNDIRV